MWLGGGVVASRWVCMCKSVVCAVCGSYHLSVLISRPLCYLLLPLLSHAATEEGPSSGAQRRTELLNRTLELARTQ